LAWPCLPLLRVPEPIQGSILSIPISPTDQISPAEETGLVFAEIRQNRKKHFNQDGPARQQEAERI
jgi:hypothetical protein